MFFLYHLLQPSNTLFFFFVGFVGLGLFYVCRSSVSIALLVLSVCFFQPKKSFGSRKHLAFAMLLCVVNAH